MSYEPEVIIEDTESILLGTQKHYTLTRVEQLVEEVRRADPSIQRLRELIRIAFGSIDRLDSLFFNHLKGSRFPAQLIGSLEETLRRRDEIFSEILKEASLAYPSTSRIRSLVNELLVELDVYFTLFDSFMALKGRYGGEEVEIVDEDELEDFEKDDEEEGVPIFNPLNVGPEDDGITAYIKTTLREALQNYETSEVIWKLMDSASWDGRIKRVEDEIPEEGLERLIESGILVEDEEGLRFSQIAFEILKKLE